MHFSLIEKTHVLLLENIDLNPIFPESPPYANIACHVTDGANSFARLNFIEFSPSAALSLAPFQAVGCCRRSQLLVPGVGGTRLFNHLGPEQDVVIVETVFRVTGYRDQGTHSMLLSESM